MTTKCHTEAGPMGSRVITWDSLPVAVVMPDLSANWYPLFLALTDDEKDQVCAVAHSIQKRGNS